MNTPLYRTVYDSLKARILAGDYPPDVALPSESRLVHDYGVSLITVRRALHELVLDGLIERRQGVGSFVREHCYRKGVILRNNADILVFAPALIVTEGQIDEIVGVLDGALAAAAARLEM